MIPQPAKRGFGSTSVNQCPAAVCRFRTSLGLLAAPAKKSLKFLHQSLVFFGKHFWPILHIGRVYVWKPEKIVRWNSIKPADFYQYFMIRLTLLLLSVWNSKFWDLKFVCKCLLCITMVFSDIGKPLSNHWDHLYLSIKIFTTLRI